MRTFSKFLLIACMGCGTMVSAQDEIKIKDLELPNAPALTLLDETSTNIETPKSLQALTTTLINSVNTNVAIEINPYMVFSKSKSFYRFNNFEVDPKDANKLVHKGWFNSLYKDLTFSVAKVKKEEVDHVSIGFRTNLVKLETQTYIDEFIRVNSLFTTYRTNLTKKDAAGISDNDRIDSYNDVKFNRFTEPASSDKFFKSMSVADITGLDNAANVDALLSKYAIPRPDYDYLASVATVEVKTVSQVIKEYKGFKSLVDQSEKDLAKYYQETEKLSKNKTKPVLVVDVAGAYSHFFDGDAYSEGHMGKLGAWTTINTNIRLEKGKDYKYLSLFFYSRYISDHSVFDADTATYTDTDYFDIGGKAEFEYHKVSFAYEYINRTKEKDNYRSVGSIKYKFNDSITINGGFGKNFEATDNQVTFLGISWGFEYDNKFKTK